MNFRLIVILSLVLFTKSVNANSYEELVVLLRSASEKDAVHRLKAQIAQAAVQRLESEELSRKEQTKLRAEVQAYCSDVQLGAMDLWYGKSVVIWGRLLLLDGRWKAARSVLLDQAEMLQNIEKSLSANQLPVSSISPLASCRYALGETYRMEYEETQEFELLVEAFRHFYNVYIKYGDSPWGAAAQEKADVVRSLIESRGKQLRINLGEHRGTFIKNKFRLGARLTAEKKFEEALEHYLDAINIYPESAKTAEAIRNIGVCYLNLGQDDEAWVTAQYLCERFAADTNAPLALLAMGRSYVARGAEQEAERIFELYLAAFPDDSRRAKIRSYFAWKAYKAADWPQVMTRFKALEMALRADGEMGKELEKAVYIQAVHSEDVARLDHFITEFPASDYVPSILGKKAQILLVADEFDAAFETLEILSEHYPEAAAAKGALSGLIVVAVEAGRFDIAEQVLERMLQDQSAYGYDEYISTGEGLLFARQFELAEKAFSAIPVKADHVFAERALMGRAAAQFGGKQFENCFQILETLLQNNPNTGRFYEARLMQARALVELKRNDAALIAYADAVAAKQDYAVIFEMAELFSNPEEQLAAYQRIALLADPDKSVNRPIIADSIAASLPLCLELHKYQLAIESCEQFEQLFAKHERLASVHEFQKEAERALGH